MWKDIKGYEGLYQVSTDGEVRSLDRYEKSKGNSTRLRKGQIKTLSVDKDGYKKIGLWKNSKVKYFRVHRLVAETFIDNPNNLSEVNHIDEDKSNNCVDNLEWCDRKYNNNYGSKPRQNYLMGKFLGYFQIKDELGRITGKYDLDRMEEFINEYCK